MWIAKVSEDSENRWPVFLWIGVHASVLGTEMITSTQKNPPDLQTYWSFYCILYRWTFCDFFQNQDTGKYSCPQLIQTVWCQGVFYRYVGDHVFHLRKTSVVWELSFKMKCLSLSLSHSLRNCTQSSCKCLFISPVCSLDFRFF